MWDHRVYGKNEAVSIAGEGVSVRLACDGRITHSEVVQRWLAPKHQHHIAPQNSSYRVLLYYGFLVII